MSDNQFSKPAGKAATLGDDSRAWPVSTQILLETEALQADLYQYDGLCRIALILRS
jgi:hypothetical protein